MSHWSDEFFQDESKDKSKIVFLLTREQFMEVWWSAQAFKWMTRLAALLGIDWPRRRDS